MRLRIQFAGSLVALGIGAALEVPSFAQRERLNWAQNRAADKPPKQEKQQPRQGRRQEQRQERRQQQQGARRAQVERRQNDNSRRPSGRNPNPPDANSRSNNSLNRPNEHSRPSNNPNRPPSAYTPPPAKRFDNLNRQEQQKILQYDKTFEKLSPAQRQELRDRQRVLDQLTPEQKSHLRNEVVPKWRQLSPDRQRAIQQRLGVLKNMPESARNQHLNDLNFTRGMSEEDKAMLRDLSHMHVGGAPEPPNE